MTRRRGAGEGNVYQRADGRWVARLHLGYSGGKRIRKHWYGHTRREVQEKLDKAKSDLHLGLPVATPARLTVRDYLRRWLSDVARPSVRPKTFATYERYTRVHLIPELGHVPLVKLSPDHVQTMLNAKLQAGLAPRTVHHLRAVLRRALNQATRWGMVPRNVATLVDPPRVPRYEVRAMTPEEARAVLESVRGDRLEALFVLALALGLRQGEALGLRWPDVDLEGGQLTINHALQRIGGRLQLVEPKTDASRRTVVLPPMVVAAIRAHRARQLAERLWAGSRWHEGAYVFTTTIGTALDGTNVTHRFQAIIEQAGLRRLRFHDLRHACASLLLAQGVHPRVVMDSLGHSSIAVTMNVYGHVIPSLQREAAERMERLLTGAPSTDAADA